jgi:hypothetical protein
MSRRPTLDASTFEGLLAAAWVLQLQHEQEARNLRPAPNEMLAEPPETHVEQHRISQREPTSVDGSSLFPGLADEVDSSFTYLLEDDVSTFHWGRVLVLVVLLGCIAYAVWRWRREVSRVGPPAGVSAVEGPQGASLHNSESQTTLDAQSTTDRNRRTPTSHKIQNLADGVWEKTATKPSPYIPFDSVTMAAQHYVRRVSSARPTAAGISMPGRIGDKQASGTVRASAVPPAGDSRENPFGTSFAVDAPQGASLHNSESQTMRHAQSMMDRNKRTPTDHKMESLVTGGREDAATKPSAGKPFDSVTIVARHYVPRPPPGFAASNIAAMAGHRVARPPSEGGPSANESRDPQIAMSRVPRPPWSSSSGKTSEHSVPRPPARRVPRAIPRFDLPTWH